MLTLSGFVIADDSNNLIVMELSENITNGLTIDTPSPVFSSPHDAERAWVSWCAQFGDNRTCRVYEITTSGLQLIATHHYFGVNQQPVMAITTEHTSENILKLVEAEIAGLTYTELWESWKSLRHNELLNVDLFTEAWRETII